jgi:hypothetical protein
VRGAEQCTANPTDQCAGDPVEPLAHQIVGRQILRNGQRRDVLLGRIALEVVDVREHVHGTDAVCHRVAQVHHHRRLAVGKALDKRHRPQRPGNVERRLRGDLGEVDQLAQRARFGQAQPPHVEIQVEVGVDHPSRRRGRQRGYHDFLAQPQHLARRAFEPRQEAVPVRGGIKDLQRHDARTRAWVCLAAVQDLVERVQFFRKTGRVEIRHVAHGWSLPFRRRCSAATTLVRRLTARCAF